jgi:hypothetical protein
MRIEKIYIHTTKDGTKIPIHRLEKGHLINIIRLALNNPANTNKDHLNIYINELRDRCNHPDHLIMDESNRFASIEDKNIKCIKTECDGWLKEYTTIKTYTTSYIRQTFCGKCWSQYTFKFLTNLPSYIQEDELGDLYDADGFERSDRDIYWKP